MTTIPKYQAVHGKITKGCYKNVWYHCEVKVKTRNYIRTLEGQSLQNDNKLTKSNYFFSHRSDKGWKTFAAKIFIKGTCTQSYSRFYVEGKQELRPFYM